MDAKINKVRDASPVSNSKPAKKTEVVANISKTIASSKSIPVGYNGADGKVKFEKGSIITTAVIEANDAGLFVEFKPVDVKDAKSLSLYIKGVIFQKQGLDHYASIQVNDEDGKVFILRELCREGKFGSCAGQPITKSSEIKKGITLTIPLDKDVKTIQRLAIVFVGEISVDAGLTISDIQLVK